MKANEAPEKLYIYFNHPHTVDYTKLSKRRYDEEVEYTRTDAFIKKACAWLSNMSLVDMEYKYDDFDSSEGWYKMIEEFRKYMEGK